MDWTGPSAWTYFFITEDGFQEMTYQEYLGDFPKTHEESWLMKAIKDRKNRSNLYLGRTIISYDNDWLKRHPSERDMFEMLREEQIRNPLQFYCPNGPQMLEFLNDTDSDLKGIIAGNRTGKTTVAHIDLLLDIIPCDPGWKIFTEHGIKYRKYAPPPDGYTAAFASYEKINIESTIWPQVIKKWTPQQYIEEYIKSGKGRRIINFKDSPKIQNDWLNIYLMYYSMSQTPFESQAIDIFVWDEQGEESKFDGADERLRTRNGRHVFSLTPHKVEGRPDTGAGSWIHDLANATLSKGHTASFYKQSMLDGVPDWVYPERQKLKAYEKWITEPEKRGDRKVAKEGRSRLYGDWHESGGMVYDEWDRAIHLVDPFEIPESWTKVRGMDWGRVSPTACVWGAVSPSGDLYIYDHYLEKGKLVSQSAREIIEKSGNKQVCISTDLDPASGNIYKIYREIESGTKFLYTVLDGRSFGTKAPNSHLTIGRMYNNYGILATPACTDDTYVTIPVVKEWFAPDWTKTNPHTGELGKPRIFIFRTLSRLISNIEHYRNKEVSRKKTDGSAYAAERPVAKDDHDLDALRYMIMSGPRYVDGFSRIDPDENVDYNGNYMQSERIDTFTGY